MCFRGCGRCLAIALLSGAVTTLCAQSYFLASPGAGPLPDAYYVINSVEGRVVVGGGASPPGRVKISLVCLGSSRPGGVSDDEGRFSFRPKRHKDLNEGVTRALESSEIKHTDVRIVYKPPSPEHVLPCDVTAELQGYRSSSAEVGLLAHDGQSLVGDRSQVDLGFMVLHRLEELDHYARSSTTSQANGSARKAYAGGIRALEAPAPNYERAAGRFEKAVEAYPGFAGAWSALGLAQWILGNEGAALQAFTRSINADPAYLMPYEVMMEMVLENENWEELDSLTARYLEISADAPMALYLSVAAAANLDKLELVHERINQLKALGQEDYVARSHAMVGAVHEANGRFSEAAASYGLFMAGSPQHHTVPELRRKLDGWSRLGVTGAPAKSNGVESTP